MDELQFFDPKAEFTIAWKSLPHWAQAGTVCFITWRTADSLPREVVQRFARERAEILREFHIEADDDWKKQVAQLPSRERRRVQWSLFCAWDAQLDAAAGECVLARPELSKIVAESLLHFDGDRYVLTDYVVMPNHVHVLVAFHDEDGLLSQCTSWKRYTGSHIQEAMGRHGEFWQVEQFDHLVRSEEQFEHYQRYIAENGEKSGLSDGTYRHYSKRM